MQVFELHFNTKSKPDQIYDSFCYEPENVYEKRLGKLYMAGEIVNALPKNSYFLDSLTAVIKKEYYSKFLGSVEKNFKECLKKANDFLKKEVERENVSWLGNLNFAILVLKDNILNFAKVGNIKILISRAGEITDVSQELELQNFEPYPLKLFGQIATGKLTAKDKIIVLTKNIHEHFSKENLIKELTSKDLEEKNIEKFFKERKKILSEISGICLLIDLTPSSLENNLSPFKKKTSQVFNFCKEKKKLSISLKENIINQIIYFLKPITFILKKIKSLFCLKTLLPEIKFRKSEKKFIKKENTKFSFWQKNCIINKTKKIINFINSLTASSFKNLLNRLSKRFKIIYSRKNLTLILVFALVLITGFFISKTEKERQIKSGEQTLKEVRLKISQAQTFLILTNEEKANILFQEALEKVLPLSKTGPLKEKAISLRKSIEENLFHLNKVEKIDKPSLVFEVNPEKINFIPQKILISSPFLYLFSPDSTSVYKFNLKQKIGESLEINQNIKMGTLFNDSILFFSEPDNLLFLENGQRLIKTFQLPYPNFSCKDIAAYKSNIYLLDNKTGEILKIKFKPKQKTQQSELWLSSHAKKTKDAISFAIDGSIWTLNSTNIINRYYAGDWQESLTLNFFPKIEKPLKIFTTPLLPELYILEPEKKRIIIINKQGKIIKQFQSEKFNDLKDFTISPDSRTIYLLNNLKIFQIKI